MVQPILPYIWSISYLIEPAGTAVEIDSKSINIGMKLCYSHVETKIRIGRVGSNGNHDICGDGDINICCSMIADVGP